MRALPAQTAILDHGESAPVVLAGPPRRLKGRIQLYNRHDERVVLRQAWLEATPQEAYASPGAANALRPVPLPAVAGGLSLSLPAILASQQRLALRVRASLDPQTPPGLYQAVVRLGDQAVPAQLHVAEQLSLDLLPQRIVLQNRPGSRQVKQLTLRNSGNVPLHIGNLGAVVLDDELVECKTVRSMLADDDEQERSASAWLSAYLRHGKRQLDATGMLWVEVAGAPMEVAAGQTVSIQLTVRIPDNLDARSRYRGVILLYDVALTLLVAPVGLERAAAQAADSASI